MKFIEHARRSRFLRHNSIFFIGAAAVGALNYLYYPVMGRLLDTVSFGEVQTLISLFLQITIFLSVMGLVTITVVTNYRSIDNRNAVVLEFEKLALIVSLVLLAIVLVFGETFARFLHFSSVMPFILLMLALVASVPFTFRGAFLRGKKRFGLASLGNLTSAAGKLVFAVLLVMVGLGTAGAIGGLILAQLVACGFVVSWAARAGLTPSEDHRLLRLPNFRLLAPELRYGLFVLIGSLIITLQYSIDVIVVKHFFDPHTAGLYAGVASVARIIFFLTASIAMVLISLVRLDARPGENRKTLTKSLLLTGFVGLPVVLVSVFEPEHVTTLLMGSAYADVAGLLPKLSIAIFVISLLNIFVSYYLALRKFSIAPALIIGAILTYVLMYYNHASLQAVVNSLLIGSIAMLGILGLWMVSRHTKELIWQES